MKTYFIIIFILMNAIAMAADSTPKKNDVSGGIVINDSLQKLMKIEGVEPIYADCQKRYAVETETQTSDTFTCLWDAVKKNTALKKQVQEVYAQELKGEKTAPEEGRAPASTSQLSLTARKASIATDYESDPAVAALSDYYGKKLDVILNPDVALTVEERKKNTILSVDHRQFIDLYKSELGKTIISAFTSYCLDTVPDSCACSQAEQKVCVEDKSKCTCESSSCVISSDETQRKKDRESNLKSLRSADLKSNSSDGIKWNMCIGSVSKACVKDPSSDHAETSKRACLIMDYVKSARKNIMVADTQLTFYNDLNSTQTANIASNMKAITDLKKTSSDALLDMTSTDVKTALEKPLNSKLKDLEGCYKDGVIVNAKACEKYLSVNKDENDKALAELGMRQIAQESILEEELSSSPQKVKDYLKEEGYSKQEIETMTADQKSIDQVKKEILDRYSNQKAAIIKEMAERIAAKTSATDGKIENVDANINKLDKIKKELESRSSDLQNLVYFNNVVSSYLEVDDRKGNSSRNTASLFAEANSLEDDQGKLIKDQIKNASLKDQKGNADTTNLEVKTINDAFLKYSVQKDKNK
ncbi:hypothetical protein SHI21_18660 [Bacteriovorax sp. PP10]|uniref:Uncharacterized protein n=1 Tax=Bacteriovorax antarcticus TaxID=3088717 RepID=A0ABU5VYX6_9BACT|nr:hypothetical protein [Bacteriovorax sp. PP10]MEA9358264.1 hypothetical protein [Bacteriovorax sp. PP10]